MANLKSNYRAPTVQNQSNSGSAGVCMMNTKWRDEQHPCFIHFMASFLAANSFRLNIVPIAPVVLGFLSSCLIITVAFIFVTNWDCENSVPMFSRIKKLKGQFANLYVIVSLPTKEQNDSFVHFYFKYGMELGKPTFVPVQDLEMGFEKIVKIAHSRGACKRQDVLSKLKAERKQSVQGMENFLRVITSIPGIDGHDANTLYQAIGSIEAIAKASKECILENSDLSVDKADSVTKFFRDPKLYLSPKIS